jgi:lysophospholipase L1-like esterase
MDDRALGTYFNQESIIKSRQLASVIKASAARLGCVFVDAAEVALPGKDGVHLTEEGHAALAKLLAKKLFDLRERTS